MAESNKLTSTTCLYSILGLAKDCNFKDISRSYRILALQYHPDKAGNQAAAREKFLEIQHAYDVLRDPKKRKKYDRTGSLESVTLDHVNIDSEDIIAFTKNYPGSSDEITDLCNFYRMKQGSIEKLYDYIPLSEPSKESLDRYLKILDGLIDNGTLRRFSSYEKSKKALCNGIEKVIQAARKENLRFEKSGQDISSLISALEANKKRRLEEGARFLLALEIDHKKRKRRSLPKVNCRRPD